MTQEFRIVKVKDKDWYAIVDQDNEIIANPIAELDKAKLVLKGLNSGESTDSVSRMKDALPSAKLPGDEIEDVTEASEKLYRTHFEDGEWFVVDQDGEVVETATDRREAIAIAADLNAGDSESAPKIHQGSSYGNTPDTEIDESEESETQNEFAVAILNGNDRVDTDYGSKTAMGIHNMMKRSDISASELAYAIMNGKSKIRTSMGTKTKAGIEDMINRFKGKTESVNEAFEKLTDKQLQDKFVDLKIKAKDLGKDSKESKQLQKIRDEIAKRKASPKKKDLKEAVKKAWIATIENTKTGKTREFKFVTDRSEKVAAKNELKALEFVKKIVLNPKQPKDLKEADEVDEGIKLFNSSTDLTKLTDKQLQDMFIHVKTKSNDAALLQKIRDERAKRKTAGSVEESFDIKDAILTVLNG